MTKFSNIKHGDAVAVRFDDILGNARRHYGVPYLTGIVTSVGRKWITVKAARGAEWRFDKEGHCEDLNEGAYLCTSEEEAKAEVSKLKMVREIRACGFDFLMNLSYEDIESIYSVVCKRR